MEECGHGAVSQVVNMSAIDWQTPVEDECFVLGFECKRYLLLFLEQELSTGEVCERSATEYCVSIPPPSNQHTHTHTHTHIHTHVVAFSSV